MMLVRRQQRCLAGRAAGHQGGGATVDLAMTEFLEGTEVDGAERNGVGSATHEP